MNWFNRRTDTTDTTDTGDVTTGAAGGGSRTWVRGQELSGRMFRAMLWLVVACGPIALGVALLVRGADATPPPVAAVTPGPDLELRRAAAETAERVTVAYLGATTGDVVLGLGRLDHAPAFRVGDVGVAAVEGDDVSGLFAVTVGVSVGVPDEDGAVAGMSRRYFQIRLHVISGGAVQVLGLPAEVAAPLVEMGEGATFPYTVSPADPVGVAAQEFLAALLTGSADVTRFTAPSATIRAVTPPPFEKVRVDQVNAPAVVPASVGDGDVAVVTVKATGDERLRLEYVLELQARAGRWEVTRILTTPTSGTSSASSPTQGVVSHSVASPSSTKEK